MTENRLAGEKSPYLLQHADNPVEWYPWEAAAFEKAQQEDKPVFLSVGYATCHWCHVMAHESFESPEVAELMNDAFINIKVDREERPDIDNTYMTVCQMMTGSGGWPLTIIMTPDKKPFYAATYIPKRGRQGRPGMMELIPWIKELWKEKREKVYSSADEIVEVFQKSAAPRPTNDLPENILEEAFDQFNRTFDPKRGGFGKAPKFPSPHNLMFLLRYWKQTGNEQALVMVEKTLLEMRMGGIYDQIGFGFHRYSTDRGWLLPHFEKMLYDQALLIIAYSEAWQATGKNLYRNTVKEIASYLLRDMTDKNGGFYCAEDADSEGEEGKFYVWNIDEVKAVLSEEDASIFINLYNLKKEGNFHDEATLKKTGKNIPHLEAPVDTLAARHGMEPEDLEKRVETIREALLKEREKRPRPLLDDKILTDWNGLMIAALARAGKVLDEKAFVERAEKATRFIFYEMRSTDGSLLHRYRDGEAAIDGHADDYAFLIWGLLELYEATLKTEYLAHATELNDIFTDRFWDGDHGGFFFTRQNSETLLGRTKEGYDGAIPSGNSVAMMNLLKLGKLLAKPELEEKADRIAHFFGEQIKRAPTGFGQMLQGILFSRNTSFEIVIAGNRSSDDTRRLLHELNRHFIPGKVVILNDPDDRDIGELAPYTSKQVMLDNNATAYVCKDYSCEQPVTDPGAMLKLLKSRG